MSRGVRGGGGGGRPAGKEGTDKTPGYIGLMIELGS